MDGGELCKVGTLVGDSRDAICSDFGLRSLFLGCIGSDTNQDMAGIRLLTLEKIVPVIVVVGNQLLFFNRK